MLPENNVEKITEDEIEIAAKVLLSAFKDDPINNYIFSNEELIYRFYITAVRYCMYYGLAIRTKNFESIALRIKPGDKFNNYWRFFHSGMIYFFFQLPFSTKLRFLQVHHIHSKKRKQIMGQSPHWYCWILGTSTNFQNQGHGSQLMNYTFKLSQQENLPLYLQTATEKAKGCHEKHGYQLIEECYINNLRQFFMVKSK